MEEVGRFLNTTSSIQILFIDDGSSDGTANLIERFATTSGGAITWGWKLRLLRMPQNRGKAEAVRFGIIEALRDPEAQAVGFWDADLATPLNSILSFLQVLNERKVDMVFGSRVKLCGRHIERRPARHYLGRVFATVASAVLGLAIYDTQCGAKLFRVTDDLRKVFATPFGSKWVFDVEILARFLQLYTVRELEEKVYEYPLETWRDIEGSKVKPLDFLDSIGQVLAIHRRYFSGKRRA